MPENESWEKVSPEVNAAIDQIVAAVEVLEREHPHTEESCEQFIEDLMNIFVTDAADKLRVNPFPIVSVKLVE